MIGKNKRRLEVTIPVELLKDLNEYEELYRIKKSQIVTMLILYMQSRHKDQFINACRYYEIDENFVNIMLNRMIFREEV